MAEQLQDLRPEDPRVSRPLFTVAEAARYLGMPTSTLRSWVDPAAGRMALVTAYDTEGHQPSVPFVGFAEAFVIRAALRAGVPEWRIRPGIEAIADEVPISHALAHKRVFTDGAEVLFRTLEGDEALEVARTRQQQIREAIVAQLELISYAGDGFAERLELPGQPLPTIIDPAIASGRPVLARSGIRIKDLRDRREGGDSEAEIAADFGIPEEAVRAIARSPAAT